MKKKVLLVSSLVLAVIVITVAVLYKNTDWFSAEPDNSIVLFFSENCSHCQNVEAFLESNNVAEKISFENKQLDNNPANVADLRNKAAICGLQGNIGIPFLWVGADKKCLMGDVDVIDFFQTKLNQL